MALVLLHFRGHRRTRAPRRPRIRTPSPLAIARHHSPQIHSIPFTFLPSFLPSCLSPSDGHPLSCRFAIIGETHLTPPTRPPHSASPAHTSTLIAFSWYTVFAEKTASHQLYVEWVGLPQKPDVRTFLQLSAACISSLPVTPRVVLIVHMKEGLWRHSSFYNTMVPGEVGSRYDDTSRVACLSLFLSLLCRHTFRPIKSSPSFLPSFIHLLLQENGAWYKWHKKLSHNEPQRDS